ncbi:MAG: hypothetical protein IVW55_06875 [Chloroflexi bacterium]|nr:hypothetical protein [Chloroflexota bacterium]
MRRPASQGLRLPRWKARRLPRRESRAREWRPKVGSAYRLLRAASRLGVPGALPAPPELLPASARVLAQGYLNRFSMVLLNGWLLPRWMREQSDPQSTHFVPRSVINLMVNQTKRNWTALGIPGTAHPIESIVDSWGLLTPLPGGPSLDWWADVDGSGLGVMPPSLQANVKQSLQGGLPVVATAFEAGGLRVSSESWMLPAQGGDWAAMQVVLFNIADMRLTGTFSFALRPYNAEGISPVYSISYDGQTLVADGHRGPITWPRPEGWALSGLQAGDLFTRPGAQSNEKQLYDPHGFAHGVLKYSFSIEPWEEAEFIAFMPVHTQSERAAEKARQLFPIPSTQAGVNAAAGLEVRANPQFYSRAKAATTLQWRSLLETGMRLSLPDRGLQASWEANREHIFALHDGVSITPGPDLYHSFWFRDAAYMVYALSACGYQEAAEEVLHGFLPRQRRNGVFISHLGEWDSTGQALWAIAQHIKLYPGSPLLAQTHTAVENGARWIARRLAKSEDGLMPPGLSAEHLGPPDRYYWDNLWSLAGLEGAREVLGEKRFGRAAAKLRRSLALAWATDVAALGRTAVPAAPGRGIDLGMVGSLVAWFPLELVPADSPFLAGTLQALEETTFYKGALFVSTGHSGWGTYLNMRIAGCYLLQGSPRGWELMRWLLRHASPTYNWPEGINPKSGGGSAGDGQHGWASAEWLLLIRALLFRESNPNLLIAPGLPQEWLRSEGKLEVEHAPTRFGVLNYTIEWDRGGRSIALKVNPKWRTPPRGIFWTVPGSIQSAAIDGQDVASTGKSVRIPADASLAEITRGFVKGETFHKA